MEWGIWNIDEQGREAQNEIYMRLWIKNLVWFWAYSSDDPHPHPAYTHTNYEGVNTLFTNANHSFTVSRPVAASRPDGMLEQLRHADDEEC